MYYTDHLIPLGTTEWWIRRAASVFFGFLGIMGFLYVFNAPLTKAEAWPGALAGALAANIFMGLAEWRRQKIRTS